ncbi:hypothetical protein BCR33DRAFT_853094 [Rhizoclosmatium globosum]|uniref:Uncharacterized protein n=1 Tax=Rhizoclosmatium globosum TaxID=329046 RepID=A0A1Y2BZ03_9FUNG|nr:hypothetical protein BCR33DRAFT_853094 [Rhizoclosmatium globosum]|eukprot:ORY39981.1 hypothetical protein BCR33DRAFT_853094 [Rhizoclosmatium globosum]
MPSSSNKTEYQWAVIGAGPAGIAAVGKLLDAGITSNQIIWIDPLFSVGFFGLKWGCVSSNTSVQLFIDFLAASPAFGIDVNIEKEKGTYELFRLPPESTCRLELATAPLIKVTETLRSKVESFVGTVELIRQCHDNSGWQLSLKGNDQTLNILTATKVVLATGSRPKTLQNADAKKTIPLETALQINSLRACVTETDTIAVYGSSHSAIMIVRDLFGRFINDSTGLKGDTAKWAKANLMGDGLPRNLVRVKSGSLDESHALKNLTKCIYAIGFEREPVAVEGVELDKYDATMGRIANGLYGVGIAFPERGEDAAGNLELQVGIWKFMRYLTRVLPFWVEDM